jgi:hypothetical protein
LFTGAELRHGGRYCRFPRLAVEPRGLLIAAKRSRATRCKCCNHAQRPAIYLAALDVGDGKAAANLAGRLHESLSLSAKE